MLLWKMIEDAVVPDAFQENTDLKEAVDEGC